MIFSLKPDFEASARRMVAFWAREVIDRPVVQFKLYKPAEERQPLPPSHHPTPAGRWMDAAYQAEYILAELSNQLFLGDTLPVAWPDLGPDVFTAFYGAPIFFGDDGTTWSQPTLADWKAAESLHFDWDSPYLHKLDEITAALLEAGTGRFLTGITGLHSGGDSLAALRGPMDLALDLVQHPEQVKTLLGRLQADYFGVYDHFYTRLRLAGLPISTWTPLLCDGRYGILANDFSIAISSAMFADIFLPGIAAECRFLDRSLYHLDGPGALRHLDLLLDIPELDAVQYVPMLGDAAFAKWAAVYRRIQAAGKCVQVICELGEIDEVIAGVRPEGLYLVVNGVADAEDAGRLLRKLKRWS
jgi:hypothetical protein